MKALATTIVQLLCFISVSAQAVTDMAVTAGVQTTEVSTSESGLSVNGNSGLSSGVIAFLELADPTYLRVGAIGTERKFKVETSGVSNELASVYLEAPINYMHMITEQVGWFAGGRVGLKLNEEDCTFNGSSCPGSDLETLIYGLEAGGHFLFSSEFGVEASYVYGLSDIAEDVKYDGGLHINGFFIF